MTQPEKVASMTTTTVNSAHPAPSDPIEKMLWEATHPSVADSLVQRVVAKYLRLHAEFAMTRLEMALSEANDLNEDVIELREKADGIAQKMAQLHREISQHQRHAFSQFVADLVSDAKWAKGAPKKKVGA